MRTQYLLPFYLFQFHCYIAKNFYSTVVVVMGRDIWIEYVWEEKAEDKSREFFFYTNINISTISYNFLK